ncbi:HAD-IIB family hydrolase [Bifidobacterium samirii]|uniref:phosphomannomutase n=1 Tax=Bifidobacterium samirii TaxID=2306974 RepID=A0A430FUH4_9BIFI|nr:phosphomannomutase [Bifidobacterium samirii]
MREPRRWAHTDLDGIVAAMKAVAFDLDNTLASSKQPMSPAMAERFAALTHLTDVAVITGGRFSLVRSQILDMVEDRIDPTHLHLMPTSGTRYYRWDVAESAWELVYSHDLSADDRAASIASLERRARELGMWEEQVAGERIEDRGSQLTFSALGQLATPDDKARWDPDDAKKRRLAAAVAADVPHLKVRPGGYTSIDVSLPGLDKSYAVRELCLTLGITPDDLVFIGDRMTPGGNDYPAAQAGAVALIVTDPSDTLRLVDAILERL